MNIMFTSGTSQAENGTSVGLLRSASQGGGSNSTSNGTTARYVMVFYLNIFIWRKKKFWLLEFNLLISQPNKPWLTN